MEEAEGVVKHVVLARFKNEVSAGEVEGLIKSFANLVNRIDSMKAFHWGTDVSVDNLSQGFTHIFEVTFESKNGLFDCLSHRAYYEFWDEFITALEKIVVFDYKPTTVRL